MSLDGRSDATSTSKWPQVRALFSKLDPFQKMALAVSAFGLATAYLLVFTAGALFGGAHMSPRPQATEMPEAEKKLLEEQAREVRGLKKWVTCREKDDDDPQNRYRFYWPTQECIKYPGKARPVLDEQVRSTGRKET